MSTIVIADEIFPIVRDCLAGSLAIPAAAVAPDARLIEDLGVDSLDFLDILFSLEKKFSVKLRGTDLDSLLRADFSKNKLVDNEYVPRAEIDRLIEWLPALRTAPDLNKVTPYLLFRYITVESLIILIRQKLPQ